MAFAIYPPSPLSLRKDPARGLCHRVRPPVTQYRASLTTAPSSKPPTSFAEWTTANRVDLKGLHLSAVDGNCRGLVTAGLRSAGDQLVSVPAALAIQVTSLESKTSPFPDITPDDSWARAPWYGKLAVRLLHAKRKGEGDPLLPWIAELPKSFDELPFYWAEGALAELQSKKMTLSVHAQRTAYRKLYDSLFPSSSAISFDEFVWAVHCLRSRCFAGELETAPFKERIRLLGLIGFLAISSSLFGTLEAADAANGALTSLLALGMYDVLTPRILRTVQGVQLKRYALIPGIDFINHSSRMNGKAEVSYEYFTDKFVVRCGEDYMAGDQVFISYGAQSNDAFLQYYGFVEQGNPADEYVFDEKIESVMKVAKGSLRAKRDVGFEETLIKEVASGFGGDVAAAREALAELCRTELSSFATCLAEDSAIKALSVQEQLAVLYRMEKKRILMSAIERMKGVSSKAV